MKAVDVEWYEMVPPDDARELRIILTFAREAAKRGRLYNPVAMEIELLCNRYERLLVQAIMPEPSKPGEPGKDEEGSR